MASISIRQNKNGSTAYVVRAYICRDAKGNARYLSRTYTPQPGMSKRKIERAVQELCAELDKKAKNTFALDSGRTFAEYAQHFIERKKMSCGEYTIHSYSFSLAKACEYIGHVPLDKLTGRHLDEMTLQMNRTRSQYGEPYSGAYIRHIQTMVRMVLGMAVKEGLLEVNIADSAHYSLPRANASEPDFLELNEAQQYIQAALDEPDLKIRSMVLLYLYTGVRMEELCGLEWQDIDYSRQDIHIRRASVYIAGEGVITKEPKTRSGVRVIRADPSLFAALKAYQNEKRQMLMDMDTVLREDTPVFTRNDGGTLIPGTTAVWLRRFAKSHGFRPVTPHKLRHTYATLQIAYGTDIRTVAGVMGHSSPMTTLTIYAHQVREASEKAARAMSEMLTPKRPQEG